jgi:hypothetical protein
VTAAAEAPLTVSDALVLSVHGTDARPSSLMQALRWASHTVPAGQQWRRSSHVTPFSSGQQSCHRHTSPKKLKEHEHVSFAAHSVQPKMSHICAWEMDSVFSSWHAQWHSSEILDEDLERDSASSVTMDTRAWPDTSNQGQNTSNVGDAHAPLPSPTGHSTAQTTLKPLLRQHVSGVIVECQVASLSLDVMVSVIQYESRVPNCLEIDFHT